MNIAKIKDVILKESSVLSPEQIELFNKKFRDRYIHVVNWTYGVPIEGTTNAEIVDISKRLTVKDINIANDPSETSGETLAVEPHEIIDPWEVCESMPGNLDKCSFVLSWNDATTGVAMGQYDHAKQYLDVVDLTDEAGDLNRKYRYINAGANAMVFTIEKRLAGYVIKHEQQNSAGETTVHYLMNKKGNIFCSETFDEDGGYWTFAFNSSIVKISSNTTEKQYLAYNKQSPRIKGYAETSSTMKFDLTLYKKEEPNVKEEPAIYFENDVVTRHVNDKPFTIKHSGVDVSGIYISSNDSVASADNYGKVTIKSVGETKITFISSETDLYLSKTIEYTLKVIPFVSDPELYWTSEVTEKEVFVNDEFTTVCKSAYDDFNGQITYESSSPAVASADNDGHVTVLSEGRTVITAKSSGTVDYKDSQISYTVVAKANPVQGHTWLAYDILLAEDLIDIAETERINSTDKWEEYNKFSPSESDLTLDEVRLFRTWLADTLYTVLQHETDYKTLEMLNYYKKEMYDDTIKHLENFYVNPTSVLSAPTQHTCACQANSATFDLSVTACDSIASYRKALYNAMVEVFSSISFWTEREKVLLEEIKKYIDYIIARNLPMVTSKYQSVLYDCSCMGDANSAQEYAMTMLKNLSKAFGYMIEEKLTDHKNMIGEALNNWATYLYEHMRWI